MLTEDEYEEPSGEAFKPENEKEMDIDENEEDIEDWERHKEELRKEELVDDKEESSVNHDKFVIKDGSDGDGENLRKKKKNQAKVLSVRDSGYEDQDDAAIQEIDSVDEFKDIPDSRDKRKVSGRNKKGTSTNKRNKANGYILSEEQRAKNREYSRRFLERKRLKKLAEQNG